MSSSTNQARELPCLEAPALELGSSKGLLDGLATVDAELLVGIGANVPGAELAALVALGKPELEMRALIVGVRFSNAVCNKCLSKTHAKLQACSRCKLTFYCSRGCQARDWKAHKTWCGSCSPTAVDTGPLRLTFLDIRPSK